MENHQIVFSDSEHRVSSTIVSAKLDLVSRFSKLFHYGTHLSLGHFGLGYIPQ